MKKKLILRGLSGFSTGITIGYVISIICSLIWADGTYSPCVPELTAMMGNEINAVILQTLLCGFVGAGFSAGSIIWEIEHWSIAKQTGIYFMTVSVIMMPTAYFTYWMEHSVAGFVSYFGIFALIFFLVWAAELLYIKHNIKKMNDRLHQTTRTGP